MSKRGKMNKLIGYIISAVGLIGLAAYTIPQVEELLKLPEQITSLYLLIGSLIILVIGVFLITKSGGSRKISEVPIYHGKNVVGFRRMGK